MSLINDALRKARLEAEKQDRDRGAPAIPSAPNHVPPRPRARRAAVAVGVLAVAFTAFLLWPRTPGSQEDRTFTADPEPTTLATAAIEQEPNPATDATEGPNRNAAPAVAKPLNEAEPPPIEPDDAGHEPVAPIQPADAATELEATTEPAPAELTTLEQRHPAGGHPSLDGGSFVRSVQIPNGVRLELQGIAWSDTHPVALVNGNAMGMGEGLGGYLIQYIHRDYVDMRRGDTTFRLRLR
ncbi:MAG: hypothetical protein VYE73_15495 [Acidobacteriota bacterium]|nr:hypothetical protein [Acidobacteriota bacterium]